MKLTTIAAIALLAQSGDSAWVERLAFWARGDLIQQNEHLQQIESELATLPSPALINSGSRTGFQTGRVEDDEALWVEVVLDEESLVDSVALIPVLMKGAESRMAGYGFPVQFKIELFDAADAAFTVFETTTDFPNPGAFPFVSRFTPRKASRIRLTATQAWENDGPRVLALAEMMIFSGRRNVALGAKVQSTSSRDNPPSWSRSNLTDHITPLGLPVVPASGGLKGYHSAIATSAETEKSIIVFLPRTVELDEITLVPMRRPEVPSWFAYGFPVRYHIETATELDFRDAKLVHDHTNRALPSPGQNLVSFALHRTPVRAIRITATRLWERSGDYVFALAEVMAFANGENVAHGARVTATDTLEGPDGASYSPDALVNGITTIGTLLDLPDWLSQLTHRHELEAQHAVLVKQRATLTTRSEHQLVTGSSTAAIVISLLSVTTFWRQHSTRRRDAERLRERLARDLHDEIGSNLSSIALISAFATQDDATPDTMRTDLLEIERVARESADSMRDMVHLISPRRSMDEKDWLTVLRGLAERSLRGITTDIQLTASAPDLEIRRELYLFIKEVLHNIAKHSQATQASFHITQDATAILIQITDNGIGFDSATSHSGHGLSNLRERAATMEAKLNLHAAPSQGTSITLSIPT